MRAREQVDFSSVHPGDVVSLVCFGEKHGDHYDRVLKEWTVVTVYPHHVLCECDGIKESFTYGEMVQMGMEHDKMADAISSIDGKRESGRHWKKHNSDSGVIKG